MRRAAAGSVTLLQHRQRCAPDDLRKLATASPRLEACPIDGDAEMRAQVAYFPLYVFRNPFPETLGLALVVAANQDP